MWDKESDHDTGTEHAAIAACCNTSRSNVHMDKANVELLFLLVVVVESCDASIL